MTKAEWTERAAHWRAVWANIHDSGKAGYHKGICSAICLSCPYWAEEPMKRQMVRYLPTLAKRRKAKGYAWYWPCTTQGTAARLRLVNKLVKMCNRMAGL